MSREQQRTPGRASLKIGDLICLPKLNSRSQRLLNTGKPHLTNDLFQIVNAS